MYLPEDSSQKIASYLKQVAGCLRQKEANALRGQAEKLEELERQTDLILVVRWAWTAGIVGLVSVFLCGTLGVSIISPFVPHIVSTLLWTILKVSMGCVALMLLAAVWLTFKPPAGL